MESGGEGSRAIGGGDRGCEVGGGRYVGERGIVEIMKRGRVDHKSKEGTRDGKGGDWYHGEPTEKWGRGVLAADGGLIPPKTTVPSSTCGARS